MRLLDKEEGDDKQTRLIRRRRALIYSLFTAVFLTVSMGGGVPGNAARPAHKAAPARTPWKDLLLPTHSDRRPRRRLSFAISGFNLWRIGHYGIRMVPSEGSKEGYKDYYDPISHYYLQLQYYDPGVPDNEGRGLLLMPKSEWIADENGPESRAPTSKTIRTRLRLVTDTGVRVGDTEAAVIRKLGRPSDSELEGDPGQRDLFYTLMGGKIHGWSYETWYRFQHGRLTSISIAMQRGPEVAG